MFFRTIASNLNYSNIIADGVVPFINDWFIQFKMYDNNIEKVQTISNNDLIKNYLDSRNYLNNDDS